MARSTQQSTEARVAEVLTGWPGPSTATRPTEQAAELPAADGGGENSRLATGQEYWDSLMSGEQVLEGTE